MFQSDNKDVIIASSLVFVNIQDNIINNKQVKVLNAY